MSTEANTCTNMDHDHSKVNMNVSSIMLTAQKKLLEEQDTKRALSTTLDMGQYSDKVPLTDLHLCRYDDCHRKDSNQMESPLDPVKTNILYILLTLIIVWLIFYISLHRYHIL